MRAATLEQKVAMASVILSAVSAGFAALAAMDAAKAAKVQAEIQRPHVNLLEDYLDIRQGDERVLIHFKNFGPVPARDTFVHVVGYDGGTFKLVDSFIDPNVLPPGKHKETPSMPVPAGMANFIFCVEYFDATGASYSEAEAFRVVRTATESGLIPLSGIGDFEKAAYLRKEGCSVAKRR